MLRSSSSARRPRTAGSAGLAAADADWDLYVLTPAGEVVSMATAGSSETLTIDAPEPGTYTVIASLYATGAGGADEASLETLELRADTGNLTVSPDPVPVTDGQATQAILAWDGPTEGTWRGRVEWGAGAATDVSVTVP